jgi:hypothetical protein
VGEPSRRIPLQGLIKEAEENISAQHSCFLPNKVGSWFKWAAIQVMQNVFEASPSFDASRGQSTEVAAAATQR